MSDRAEGAGRETATGRLARLGFTDVPGAERDLALIGAGPALVEELSAAADPDLAVRSLARILSALDGSRSGAELRERLAVDPLLARRLSRVLGWSSALGDHLARHSDDCRELADPDLDQVRPTAAALGADLTSAVDADDLRRRYRRLLLRLAARDLTGGLSVSDAAGELADLASAAVEGALRLAQNPAGAPEGSGEPRAAYRLAVIGLGKCGGRELNYVSDVDVLFVAEPASDSGDEAKALRQATAAAAAMMRLCSAHTAEGTLWPVDAGLRPEGDAGPLVRTPASHVAYYERWAQTWEFQALLKARVIAGDRELGRRFLNAVEPLVWSAASRPDFVVDVQAMRRRVVEALPPGAAEREIKLGPGGLRDIEFAVQLLQLVHGRTDADVRQPNTWQALAALTAGGYVGRDDGARLGAAYSLLRTLEHRLQLAHLRRTHEMPTSRAELRVLGRSIGLTGDAAEGLTDLWRSNAREVRRLHERLFYRPLLSAVAALPAEAVRLAPEAARARLVALGYADPDAALRHLEALTAGVSRRATIQRALLPAMLGWFADGPDPDLGLLAFRRLSEALGSSHTYLRALRDEGATAERLARLLSSSRYAVDLLMRAPDATAILGDDAALVPAGEAGLTTEAEAAAGREGRESDPDEAIAAVRAVRRRELFRIAAADVIGRLDVVAVGEGLASVTVATMRGALLAAQRSVEATRGGPLPARLAVIAMGRLGGRELSYGSDADVLFVCAPASEGPGGDADDSEVVDAATAVASELRRLLALPGPDPALPVDADLRPEGRQGPLVRTLAAYTEYYRRWSKVWEAQALLRAVPIAGDAALGAAYLQLIDPIRYPAEGLSAAEVAEVRRVKARVDAERLPRGVSRVQHVKLGPGGIADVEWTVQLLQLRHAGRLPALRTTGTLRALAVLQREGLVTGRQAARLEEAWRRATALRNASMLVRGRQSDLLPGSAPGDRAVAWLRGEGVDGVGRLVDGYRRAARRARQVVDDLFWTD